jgi:DeoR family suf operon transcriptional repressor
MHAIGQSSDQGVIDLLRDRPMGIAELAGAMGVTATAVRQRLTRLMAQGLVERQAARRGRGRPSHRYSLTDKGVRQAGNNFSDLTIALWREVRAIRDPEIQRGLLQRLASTLATMYGGQMAGESLDERMHSLAELFAQRSVPVTVGIRGDLPVLTALACPYPDLAEEDRGVCAVEKQLFSELLGEPVRLTECRLDGASCCRFEPGQRQAVAAAG